MPDDIVPGIQDCLLSPIPLFPLAQGREVRNSPKKCGRQCERREAIDKAPPHLRLGSLKQAWAGEVEAWLWTRLEFWNCPWEDRSYMIRGLDWTLLQILPSAVSIRMLNSSTEFSTSIIKLVISRNCLALYTICLTDFTVFCSLIIFSSHSHFFKHFKHILLLDLPIAISHVIAHLILLFCFC